MSGDNQGVIGVHFNQQAETRLHQRFQTVESRQQARKIIERSVALQDWNERQFHRRLTKLQDRPSLALQPPQLGLASSPQQPWIQARRKAVERFDMRTSRINRAKDADLDRVERDQHKVRLDKDRQRIDDAKAKFSAHADARRVALTVERKLAEASMHLVQASRRAVFERTIRETHGAERDQLREERASLEAKQGNRVTFNRQSGKDRPGPDRLTEINTRIDAIRKQETAERDGFERKLASERNEFAQNFERQGKALETAIQTDYNRQERDGWTDQLERTAEREPLTQEFTRAAEGREA